MAVTMQSLPAVTPQFLPVVTMQSTPRPSHPAATMHTAAIQSTSSAATMQPTPTNTFQSPEIHPSQQGQMLAGSTQTYMPPPPLFTVPLNYNFIFTRVDTRGTTQCFAWMVPDFCVENLFATSRYVVFPRDESCS